MTYTQKPYSDVEQALYDLVHSFPNGAPALAPLVRMNPGTLSNKVDPRQERHHLTVAESVQIQLTRQLAQVDQPLALFQAEARLFKQIVIPMPEATASADMDVLDAWAAWHQDTGETAAVIKQAMAGKRISKKILAELKREIFEDAQRELELFHILEAMADE